MRNGVFAIAINAPIRRRRLRYGAKSWGRWRWGGSTARLILPIALRAPVIRPGNVRDCDDCIRSALNDFCAIKTPISLPSWDHIAECVRGITSDKLNLSFAAAERKSANARAPSRPGNISSFVLAVWSPIRKCFSAPNRPSSFLVLPMPFWIIMEFRGLSQPYQIERSEYR